MLVGHGGLVTLLVGRCAGWWMWVSPCGLIAVGGSLCIGSYVGSVAFGYLGLVALLVGRCGSVAASRSL